MEKKNLIMAGYLKIDGEGWNVIKAIFIIKVKFDEERKEMERYVGVGPRTFIKPDVLLTVERSLHMNRALRNS